MNRCAHFQAQMLEYVYGLLDPGEIATVEAHLEDCPHCQQAHERALGQQDQLGRAARLSFPKVRFDVPVGERLVVELNHQAARGNSPHGGSSGWFRWAVAAGILLMITSLGIPAGLYSQQRDQLAVAESQLDELRKQAYRLDADFNAAQKAIDGRLRSADDTARQADQNYQQQLDQVDKELAEIDRTIKSLAQDRDKKLGQVRREVGTEQLHMTIRGPVDATAGKANQYQVETRTLNQPASATLFFRVVDESKRVVYEQKADTKGRFQLALPADLPVDGNLTLEVRAQDKEGKQLASKLSLAAPTYLTHLCTDRQSYRPGDVVRYRSLTLDRFTLKPIDENLELTFAVLAPDGSLLSSQTGLAQLVKQNDGVLLGPQRTPLRGIGAGSYRLPAEAAPGLYTLSVSERHDRFPSIERTFKVEKTETAPLLAGIHFDRAAYRGGQSVTVSVTPPANMKEKMQQAVPSAQVDGKELPLQRSDKADGSFTCTFKLPKSLPSGDAKLKLTLAEAEKTLTVEKAVPLQLDRLHVGFYPEGGDLVAGVPNRVYFQAWTPRGEPVTIRGRIVDKDQRVVADVATLDARQGRGRFHFTPSAGASYRLIIDEPARVKQILNPAGQAGASLPAIQTEGVVLHTPTGVVAAIAPLRLSLRSAGKDRNLVVTAHCRGQLVAQTRVQAKALQNTAVQLDPSSQTGGIYRLTVAEEITANGKLTSVPRAERLVYRLPGEKLGLSLLLDKAAYAPGEQVKLRCQSRDEKGEAIPSVVMVAVTEPDVDEPRQVSMPGFFLLGTDMVRPQDLEYADFLLENHADTEALDLLLATQGWRHFVAATQEVLARNRLNVNLEVSPFLLRMSQIDAEFAGDLLPLSEKLVQASVTRRGLLEQRLGARQRLLDARGELTRQAEELDTKLADAKHRLETENAEAQARYQAAQATLAKYDRAVSAVRQWCIPLLTLVLFVAGAVGLAMSAFRRGALPGTIPYFATAACALALFAMLATFQLGTRSNRLAHSIVDDPVWNELKPGTALAKLERVAPLQDLPQPVVVPPAEGVAGGAGKLPAPARPVAQENGGRSNRSKDALAVLDYQFVERQFDKLKHAEKNEEEAVPEKKSLLNPQTPPTNTKGLRESRVEELNAPPPPPFVVRDYGYRQSQAKAGEYAATLCWQPALVLQNGEAQLLFDMGTGRRYRILVAGHTLDGRLDSISVPLVSRPVQPSK